MRLQVMMCAALVALAFSGCGGSDGNGDSGGGPGSVSPKLEIAWPERSRAFDAPESAQSGVVTLHDAAMDGTDVSILCNRPTVTAAVVKSYTSGQLARRGTYLATMRFHGEEDGSGSVVGAADVTVSFAPDGSLLRADGSPLGAIGFVGTISVVALEMPFIEVGETKQAAVTALSLQGNIIVVPSNAIRYQVLQGAQHLQANPDGTFTGISQGTASIQVSIDGVSSDVVLVTVVTTGIEPRILDLDTNRLLYDSVRGKIWASLPSSTPNGNSVVDINPATGAMGTPIFVGSEPEVMAMSTDGTTLYVGLNGVNAIRRVNLQTRQAGAQFSLTHVGNNPLVATDIGVHPLDKNIIAVTTLSTSNHQTYGAAIYENGISRPNMLSSGQGSQLEWASATRIVSYQDSFPDGKLLELAVDDQGVSLVRTVDNVMEAGTTTIHLTDGRLYGNLGGVADAGSLAKLGQFTFEDSPRRSGPAIQGQTAYFVISDSGQLEVVAFDSSTFVRTESWGVELSITLNALDYADPVVWSDGKLAFRIGSQVVFLDDLP